MRRDASHSIKYVITTQTMNRAFVINFYMSGILVQAAALKLTALVTERTHAQKQHGKSDSDSAYHRLR